MSACTKECLPKNLEFLIQETYNWFTKSSQRQSAYKQIYSLINDGATPLKIVQACQTRWLSIEAAVTKIVDQWVELKTHFGIARGTQNCYTAELRGKKFGFFIIFKTFKK